MTPILGGDEVRGKLVDSLPGGYVPLNVEEADFYVAELRNHNTVLCTPVRHKDKIKVRQNPDKKRTSCVRSYVFIDKSD